MGESGDSSSYSYLKEWKGFWCNRFAYFENYSRFFNKSLPPWTDADVDSFIAIDPVHGPVLQTAREVRKFANVGTVVGAISTAGWAWKYSKSPHGAVLALGAGAVFGWTFGQEIGSHTYQMYRYDPLAAQVKFLEWWENKSQGRS